MAHPAQKQKLINELATARTELGGYCSALGHDLDFSSRLKRGVQVNPGVWFGGAALIGLLLSRIPAREKKVVIRGNPFRSNQTKQAGKAAFGLMVLKFILDLGKPAILSWLKRQLLTSRHSPLRR